MSDVREGLLQCPSTSAGGSCTTFILRESPSDIWKPVLSRFCLPYCGA